MKCIIKITPIRFADSQQVMGMRQHCFRHSKTCLTNLWDSSEQWSPALYKKAEVDVICFDFRKAVVCVLHLRLLPKLNQFGISGRFHSWMLRERGEGYLKFIELTKLHPQQSRDSDVQYQLNGELLRCVRNQRDLVVIVDETIKPHRQSAKAAKSENPIIRAIRATKFITSEFFH